MTPSRTRRGGYGTTDTDHRVQPTPGNPQESWPRPCYLSQLPFRPILHNNPKHTVNHLRQQVMLPPNLNSLYPPGKAGRHFLSYKYPALDVPTHTLHWGYGCPGYVLTYVAYKQRQQRSRPPGWLPTVTKSPLYETAIVWHLYCWVSAKPIHSTRPQTQDGDDAVPLHFDDFLVLCRQQSVSSSRSEAVG